MPTAAKNDPKNADGSVKISWTGLHGQPSLWTIKYTVFRDNLAVATVTGWSATPAVAGTSTYAVRAVDKAGNTSATTAPIAVTVP